MNPGEPTSELLPLCQALLRADPNIRDIVAFGSAVYAPDLARDLDLLVVTTSKKDSGVYSDAAADWPIPVDILVNEPGEAVGADTALGVCAERRVLYGDGSIVDEVRTAMPAPAYEDAYDFLRIGDDDLRLAHLEKKASLRDKRLRLAFDALFHAARHASMTFLSTENQRWGELRRALPDDLSGRFREMINTLHILYSYDGRYPQDRVDEEFSRWRGIVEEFVRNLEDLGTQEK